MRERIGLVPVRPLVSGVLGKHLGSPTHDVRTEYSLDLLDDLPAEDVLAEEIDVQMPIVSGQPTGVIQLIDCVRAVEYFTPELLVPLPDLLRRVEIKRANEAVVAKC